ncbi:hypothetical protein BJ322DRAFT_283385 [Thelephora terrestris]|uniref:C2H2-type domain-containing protein n=1 Tax=Thelephora terrestris TaxID=56493 RepID=A0A9P6H6W6_9AGAM|nr:hypothetical protein BJ322DRAFT_283385 [Thelephora terrestris]
MFGEPVFEGDLAYQYLAREASETPAPYFPEWPGHSPSTNNAFTGFIAPSLTTNEIPLSPTSSLSPQSQGPPSPQHTRRSSPRPDCHRAVPSFDTARRKWYCSVCQDAFHDKYECERHIGNVGKQALCLACGKTICARKDNRRRHYDKYCKRKDLGKDGGVSLEDAFAEV